MCGLRTPDGVMLRGVIVAILLPAELCVLAMVPLLLEGVVRLTPPTGVESLTVRNILHLLPRCGRALTSLFCATGGLA